MKSNSISILIILCFIGVSIDTGLSQHIDSTGHRSSDRSKVSPAIGLISLGLLTNHDKTKSSLQNEIHHIIGRTNSRIDDYIQYAPSLGMLAYQLQMNTPRSERLYHLRQYVLSGLVTQAITYTIKFGTDQKRPRGGPRAFPSGHTSFAFATATVLFNIHKEDRPFLAWSFYIPAVVTGAMRIMRNDHWAPDVLAGAGIGILTTQLTYIILHKKKRQNAVSSKLHNLHFGMTSTGFGVTYLLY